jgi:hypothetical protein
VARTYYFFFRFLAAFFAFFAFFAIMPSIVVLANQDCIAKRL